MRVHAEACVCWVRESETGARERARQSARHRLGFFFVGAAPTHAAAPSHAPLQDASTRYYRYALACMAALFVAPFLQAAGSGFFFWMGARATALCVRRLGRRLGLFSLSSPLRLSKHTRPLTMIEAARRRSRRRRGGSAVDAPVLADVLARIKPCFVWRATAVYNDNRPVWAVC